MRPRKTTARAASLLALLYCLISPLCAQITATGGTVQPVDINGYRYFVFTSTTAANSFSVTAAPSGATVEVLVVAGGGGGGGLVGGGGGAGGLVVQNVAVSPGSSFAVTVGAGGTGGEGWNGFHQQGTKGTNSVFGQLVAYGGGAGNGHGGNSAGLPFLADGGSGGGSCGSDGLNIRGTGIPGQGHDGGSGANGDYGGGGGGAGAGAVDIQNGYVRADGGAGLLQGDFANLVPQAMDGWFAGGGGGGTRGASPGLLSGVNSGLVGYGGRGGGGNGSFNDGSMSTATAGQPNTGGGGGAGGYSGGGEGHSGGDGGSGVVIVRYAIGAAIPAITSTSLPNGTVGTAYSYQVTATNATGFTATLPDGLAISPSGLISGIPTTAGSPSVSITPANGTIYGNTWTATLTIGPATPPNNTVTTWVDNGQGGIYNTVLGNFVGIGTATPGAKLHVASVGGSSLSATSALSGDVIIQGNTGGRSITQGASLEFAIPANTDGSNVWGQARIIAVPDNPNNSNATGRMVLGTRRINTNGSAWVYGSDITIDGAGDVTIGTPKATPQNAYLLNVAGPVRADKLTVNTTGADFVFDSAYRLPPLEEVETYVKKNSHLPGIATAVEMQKEGVEVGESQAKLLQKIEELTLYSIAQGKKQRAQDKLIAEQNKMLLGMKKELEKIKKRDKQPK